MKPADCTGRAGISHEEEDVPRIDDFHNAFKLAAEELKGKDLVEVARSGRIEYDPNQRVFSFDFIGRPHLVHLDPEVRIEAADSDKEVPIQEQGIILHYLNTADGTPLENELITYREVPSGEFYFSAFVKRAEAPMLSVFGQNPERLLPAAEKLGGLPVSDMGDAAARIKVLPMVDITLVIWGGDDEFEPAGKILFDKSVSRYFSTEDIAVVSGMVVYRLMRLAG